MTLRHICNKHPTCSTRKFNARSYTSRALPPRVKNGAKMQQASLGCTRLVPKFKARSTRHVFLASNQPVKSSPERTLSAAKVLHVQFASSKRDQLITCRSTSRPPISIELFCWRENISKYIVQPTRPTYHLLNSRSIFRISGQSQNGRPGPAKSILCSS